MENKVSVKVAENCGFCFGVRRAVDTVYELRKKTDKKIYIIGELIHNEIFIKRLEKDGIYCIEESDIDSIPESSENAILVIRTHGITKALNEKLNLSGYDIVDATCPFVKRIHKIVDENSDEKGLTVIFGDKKHPEVIGIQSYAKSMTAICSDAKECEEIVSKFGEKSSETLLLVSQTTGNNEKYVNCQKVTQKLYTKSKIFDTICSVTENRQKEVKLLAEEVSIMCVIGCTKSSNTKKLYEIAKNYCKNVYLLETADDLDEKEIKNIYNNTACKEKFVFGITAGASTPDDIIEEVKVRIENILF